MNQSRWERNLIKVVLVIGTFVHLALYFHAEGGWDSLNQQWQVVTTEANVFVIVFITVANILFITGIAAAPYIVLAVARRGPGLKSPSSQWVILLSAICFIAYDLWAYLTCQSAQEAQWKVFLNPVLILLPASFGAVLIAILLRDLSFNS